MPQLHWVSKAFHKAAPVVCIFALTCSLEASSQAPSKTPTKTAATSNTKAPAADSKAAYQYFQRSENLKLHSNLEEALSWSLKANALDPHVARYHLQEAFLVFSLQDNDALALQQVQIAENLDPKDPNTQLLKAQIESRLKHYPEALVSIDKALLGIKNDPYIFSEKARILRSMNRLPEAEAVLALGFKHGFINCSEHNLRAAIATKLAHWPIVIEETRAMLVLSDCTAMLTERASAYRNLALAYSKTGQIELAKKTYLEAIKSLPDDRPILVAAHDFFISIKDTKDATATSLALKQVDSDIAPMP